MKGTFPTEKSTYYSYLVILNQAILEVASTPLGNWNWTKLFNTNQQSIIVLSEYNFCRVRIHGNQIKKER